MFQLDEIALTCISERKATLRGKMSWLGRYSHRCGPAGEP